MTANSPQAYFLSSALHAAAVAAVLLLGLAAEQRRSESPKIFELVAGAGDNYAATVAPALGTPGGIKVTIPEPPQAAPEPPQPAQVEQAPPAPAKPTPAPVAASAAPAKASDIPNYTNVVQSTANRKAARLEAKYKKELAAEERRRQTYEQFQKEHAGKAGHSNPRVDAEGIAGGVVGGSTANKTGGAGGKALTREEQSLLDSYFAFFKARLKENHMPPPDVSDKMSVRIEFFMAADGSVSRVRVVRSSGNAEFDRSVLEAVRKTRVGPRPDGHSDEKELEFRMRDEDAE